MHVTCDLEKTNERRLEIERYMTENVMDVEFRCSHFGDCKSSHPEQFYEGQLHHIGRYYDLLMDEQPLRAVVVGQEYGYKPARVGCEDRYEDILKSAHLSRFKAEGNFPQRNPHMRGTTNVLRLLFGIPLGTDHESEFINIDGELVHIFDAFALINYLLCSAVSNDGSSRGMATRTMKQNCKNHFREVMQVLAPSVVIVQGKGFSQNVLKAFDSFESETDHIYRAKLGTNEILVAVFSHPSAHFPSNWGANCTTPYLLNTVAPSVESIRRDLQRRGQVLPFT